MTLPEKNRKNHLMITFYAFITLVLSFLFFKYIFGCILPFISAFVTAYLSRKAVPFLCSKFNFKRRFSVLVITVSIIIIICTSAYVLISRIVSEISALSDYLTEENITIFISETTSKIKAAGSRYLPGFAEKLSPVISEFAQNLDEFLSRIIQVALPYIAKFLVSFFGAMPSFLLFIGISVIATYYFGCDYEIIVVFIKQQFNNNQNKFLIELKNQFFKTILNVVRAYAILISLTFIQLLTGFLILKIKYATLLALLISFIDILPILGTGTVLIPWAIVLFITGNLKIGLCILVLYVIITILRQIAEPKILGSSLGLHPLVTLVSMYSGVKLMGVKGLFIVPFTVIIIKNLNDKGFIRLYKNLVCNNIKTTDKTKEKNS